MESRDLAHHLEIKAICFASLAGNPSVDASKISELIADCVNNAITKKMPYMKLVDAEDTEKSDKEKYFKQLEEFKRELEAKKEKEAQSKVDLLSNKT